jgi:hypothetical protein
MARPGITYEAVAEAAQALLLRNEKITILKIREEMGDVGSTTTISKFYKEWKEQALASSAAATQHVTDTTQSTAIPEQPVVQPVQNEAEATPAADPNVQALINNAKHLSQEMLNTMSNEWDIILNETDPEIKARKLHSALIKEQARRESAENMGRDARQYADDIKTQITHRVNDLRDTLEGQIAFLNGQIRHLKKNSEVDLEYYRHQLTKANEKILTISREND